jgi:hypothetical protein
MNVRLHTADIKMPFPEELRGQYDIVHLRLLVCALNEEEWLPVAQHCLALLRPGGMIQWDEGDHFNSRQIRGGEPGCTVAALRKAADKFATDCGHKLRYGWSTLPQVFRDLGLEEVQTDVVSIDRVPETRERWTINGMVGIFGYLRVAARMGGVGIWSLKDLDGLEEEVRKDIASGGYSRFEIYVTWGRKV